MTLEPVARESWSLEQSVHVLRDGLDETVGWICRRLDSPIALGGPPEAGLEYPWHIYTNKL
jgi:hypothetical protein